MNVAELFVRCLESEGVEYVFGVPGEENEDLLFALEGSSITFVPTRHEQGAAFMANVWGRLTGRAGVCLSTLGPGATNLMTGVADAYLDKSPLVAITGQADLRRLHLESHQSLDIVNMFRPITKWNTAITDGETVSAVVRKAFKWAEMEKPGSTHIELSEDVAAEVVSDIEPMAVKTVRRAFPDKKALDAALSLLRQSRRPLILAGNGAIRQMASQNLRSLVERFRIPVVHTFMGKGAVSHKSAQSLLSIGLGFRDFVMQAVEQADLILTVGYDIAEYAPERWNPKLDKRIVHIDFTPAEVYVHYSPDVEVVCDIAAALDQLRRMLERADCHFDTTWYVSIRQRILEDIASYDLQEGDVFTIPGVINVISPMLDNPGDLLISDVGTHKMWIARNYLTDYPNGCIISNGLASMGIALPGGIAASLVNRDRNIVAAMGDGGFLMNSQELETAKRVGAAFTVLVFNDNDYGLISWKQQIHRGRSTSTRIGNPDFKQYAESFGIKAYRPHSVAQLKEDLHEAVDSRRLCVMEIPVSTHVNDQLVAKLEREYESQRLGPKS